MLAFLALAALTLLGFVFALGSVAGKHGADQEDGGQWWNTEDHTVED